MTPSDLFDPLPPDSRRGLVSEQDGTADYGMHDADGNARVGLLVDQVSAVLDTGLGRETALLVLLGGCLRLMRDGHHEHADTVVRESIRAALDGPCARAGVAPLTDAEIHEAEQLVSLREVDALRTGFVQGLAAEDRRAAIDPAAFGAAGYLLTPPETAPLAEGGGV